MKLTNFVISKRGLIFWNTILNATLKEIEFLPLFKAKVKEMLLSRASLFRSFNDFKFNVLLLKYLFLFSYVIISHSLYYS